MNRRDLILGSAVAIVAARAEAAPAGLVLLELFTSQGCSSCPPADAALARLALEPYVVPLAFHVTYWDRLGWKDTLGDERFTARQRAYAARFPRGQLYTPQMVVVGEVDLVGSDPRLDKLVTAVRDRVTASLITIDATGAFDLAAARMDGRVDLWWAAYDPPRRIAIGRGELSGETLEYTHAVRELVQLDSWNGTTRTGELPLARLRRAGHAGVVIVAQRAQDGHILAIGRRELAAS